MKKEIFKDIEGFEGLYQVSNTGKVKSLDYRHTGKERVLKQCKNKQGYFQLHLFKDGKCKLFRVNRLVADAFIPNPENKPEVGHKDDVKTNNVVSNLYWTDHISNCNYGGRNERMKKNMTGPYKSKRVICVETNIIYPSTIEAKRQTGINQSNICQCCRGKLKTAGGFHWQYICTNNQ